MSSINYPEGVMAGSRKGADDEYSPVIDEDEEFLFGDDDDEDEAWRLRPEWLHPGCRNVCFALEVGTCCKYPDNPLVRVAVDLAESVDALIGRLDGDCAETGTELARALRLIPGLLAQVHAILPRLNKSALTQLLCPVGRLASALHQVCGGCPWGCGDPAVPDRRAEFVPLIELVGECSAAVKTRLGWRSRAARGSRPDPGSHPGRGSQPGRDAATR
jgi:hypothetical protein